MKDSLSAITKTNKLNLGKLQLKIDSLSNSIKNSSYEFIGKLVKFYDPEFDFIHIYTFKLCAEGDYYDEHKFQASSKIYSTENIKEGNIYEITIGYDQNEGGYLVNTLLEIKETQKQCVW